MRFSCEAYLTIFYQFGFKRCNDLEKEAGRQNPGLVGQAKTPAEFELTVYRGVDCACGLARIHYKYMKAAAIVLVLVFCGLVFTQTQRSAQATYSSNGVLIGLADLAPLRDCRIRSIEGKVKTVKEKGGVVSFDVESKSDRMTFQFPLSRLASAEQSSFHKDFLHKGLRLRASGYACRGEDDPLEAISIERAY
jgi:hypothetical protein